MIDLLIFFIGASLWLYVLLGGSDYGAGIIELWPAGSLRTAQKKVINHAMGPVWEANHMWLILIVVILFMGFPPIFTTLMVYLHLPMLALLGGIVVRGAAFTFRHYDAVQAKRSQRVYTVIFGLSSLWTAFWLGIIVASLNRGLIDREAASFWTAYIAPWWGWFPVAVGGFVVCIFGFLASIFLVGETDDPVLQRRFTRHAAGLNGLVILSGAGVFFTSLGEANNLMHAFLRDPRLLSVLVIAKSAGRPKGLSINRRHVYRMRAVAAGQVTLILVGWLLLYAPNALTTAEGPVNFYTAASPPATLRQLVIALLVGSVFIFPSLLYLFRVFKLTPPSSDD